MKVISLIQRFVAPYNVRSMNEAIAEIESQTYKAHHKSIFRAIVNPTIANGQGDKRRPRKSFAARI